MIVVFGSINIDFIVPVGTLPRPGETVVGSTYRIVPGGKGANQAVAAAKAGGTVRMVGAVGRDLFAEVPLAALKVARVDVARVQRIDTDTTGGAFICVDEAGENQIAVASGANRTVTADLLPDDWLGPETTLLLQMEINPAENWRLADRARAQGARILLNLAPALPIPGAVLDSVDALTVNQGEAQVLAESLGFGAAEPVAAAKAISAAHGLWVVLSRGAAGAIAVTPDAILQIGALDIAPVDTTGAGDAFVGVLAAGLDAGAGLPEALHYASVAGGLACLTPGAMPSLPSLAQIEARLAELDPPRPL